MTYAHMRIIRVCSARTASYSPAVSAKTHI